MLSALFLPLLLAVAAPEAPRSPDSTTSAATSAATDDPPVRLSLSGDRRYRPGDRVKVRVETEDDGYLLVFHVDPDGTLRVLFPLDPDDDAFVRGDRRYELKGRGGREAFEADDDAGRGWVFAAVSRAPLRLDGFVLGDHWDYRALAPDRLPEQPEAELTELVGRMAGGEFEYDLLSYDVGRYDVAEHTVVHRYYSPRYRPCFACDHYGYGRSGVHIGVTFGRPYGYGYYDSYYDDYWYSDPFYDPWYHDSWYYRPVYRYPVIVYPRYYYPRGRYPYAYGGWRGHDRPGGYPYGRYGGNFGDGIPYRDRRFDGSTLRATNTVYAPALERRREIGESPVRRLPATDPMASPGVIGTRDDIGAAPRRRGEAESPAARPSDRTPGRASERSAERPAIERRRLDREPERTTIDAAPRRRSLEEVPREDARRTEPERPRVIERPLVEERRSEESRRGEEPRRREETPRYDAPERRAEPRREETRREEPRRAEPSYQAPRSEPRRSESPRAEPRREPSSGGARSGGGGGDGGGRRRSPG